MKRTLRPTDRLEVYAAGVLQPAERYTWRGYGVSAEDPLPIEFADGSVLVKPGQPLALHAFDKNNAILWTDVWLRTWRQGRLFWEPTCRNTRSQMDGLPSGYEIALKAAKEKRKADVILEREELERLALAKERTALLEAAIAEEEGKRAAKELERQEKLRREQAEARYEAIVNNRKKSAAWDF